MVDVEDAVETPSAGDFIFKVGRETKPATWANAPAPTSVTVRLGAGVDGSDRVTIIWPDNAIANQWLEVTYAPAADVFYFGSVIGETGTVEGDTEVTPTDEIDVRAEATSIAAGSASISNPADFNRDKKVGPTDALISRNNGTNSATAVPLISMEYNPTPNVNAGSDVTLPQTSTANLLGSVTDDQPAGELTATWSLISGPGTVDFGNASSLGTTATFSAVGTYKLMLMVNDGDKNGADIVTIQATGAFLADDFDDNNLDGWTIQAGSLATAQYETEPGYEVHASAANSRMKADLPEAELSDTVYMSVNVRNQGTAHSGGWIWFVGDDGSGFGVNFLLSQTSTGVMNYYIGTDDGETRPPITVPRSYTVVPAATGDDGLKKIEFVYDRVNDQLECIFDGTSLGTKATESDHRNVTGVILKFSDQYSAGSSGIGVDDVYIGNVPSN